MAAGRGEGSGPGLVDIRNTHVTETTQTVTLGLSCLCGVWLWVAVTPSLKHIYYIYSKRHIPWSNHIFYYVSLLRTFHWFSILWAQRYQQYCQSRGFMPSNNIQQKTAPCPAATGGVWCVCLWSASRPQPAQPPAARAFYKTVAGSNFFLMVLIALMLVEAGVCLFPGRDDFS